MAPSSLHQRLTLHVQGDEKYTFVPEDPSSQSLSILRNEGDIVLNPPNTPPPSQHGRTVFGIVGIISLSLTEYVIVITGREKCGKLMGQEVYHAIEFDVLPISPHVSASHPFHPVEARMVGLVRSHLQSGYFLFSYGVDVTRRIQAQWESREKDQGRPMWDVADDRFFWNKHLQSRLIDITINTRQDLSPFILPMIYGTFDSQPASLNNYRLNLVLISRRSRYRAGTRYFKRGIDSEGHAANFNETEQILTVEGRDREPAARLSFVQIRGSIPIYWAEVNNLRYMPDLQIMDLQDTANAMRAHLQEQVAKYGATSLVNLINHKGHEKPIKDAYEKYVKQLNMDSVRYEYFDFHAECSRMRWDRISLLLENMQEDLENYGYFHLDANEPEPLKLQTGVIRTNCMDNLDRTNVTQAAFARWTLEQQLKALGIMTKGDTISQHEDLDSVFRFMWADHADLISTAYAGTPALKTDFTRTGKRTRQGALEDFSKSAMRYLKNNYFDGPRQDAFDIFTGAFTPRRGPAAMLALVHDNRPLVIRSMPYVAWFSLFMVLAGLTLPRSSTFPLLYYFILWFTLLAGSTGFIFTHGTEYVAWPRLVPPTDVLLYTGPGYRARTKGKDIGIPILDEKKAQWMMQGRKRAESKTNQIEMGTKKRVD